MGNYNEAEGARGNQAQIGQKGGAGGFLIVIFITMVDFVKFFTM